MRNVIASVFLMIIFTGSANSAAINSLTITGGEFLMAGSGGSLNPAVFSNMSIGGYDGAQPDLVGSQADYAPFSIATLEFGMFGALSVYTAESDGIRTGFTPISGDITNNTLSLDLSSWTAYWNGSSFNVGSTSHLGINEICSSNITQNCSTAITTTYDPLTGEFTASWSAVIIGGALPDGMTSWFITGQASAVPVPAAVWLFATGLLGFAGVIRKRRI